MKVRKISFECTLEQVEDLNNTVIEVSVELEDNSKQILFVCTLSCIDKLMKQEGFDYLEPGSLFIIVTKMNKGIIEKTIRAYAEHDAYWLKLYHYAAYIPPKTFTEMDKTFYDDDLSS